MRKYISEATNIREGKYALFYDLHVPRYLHGIVNSSRNEEYVYILVKLVLLRIGP